MSDLIRDMLDNIIMDNHANAQENFQDLIAAKVTDVLDAHKIQVAQSLGADKQQD
jgi:hypothetical protein